MNRKVARFVPGQTVWQAITPATVCALAERASERIAPYFVIESKVLAVRADADGEPLYSFDTHFDASRVRSDESAGMRREPERLCESREEALGTILRIYVREKKRKSASSREIPCITSAELDARMADAAGS